jgi:hypothetical protein
MEKQLESLTIHRFRGLRDLELSGLGDVNLFVGENNSGKTTVLEAISTHCRPLDIFEWLDTSERREIKTARTSVLDTLKWLFPQVDVPEGTLYTGETFISGSGCFPVLESRATFSEFVGIASSFKVEEALPLREREADYFLDLDSKRWGANLELATVIRVVQPALFDRSPTTEISETFQLWEDERFTVRKAPPGPLLPVAAITPVSHRVEQIHIKLLTEATLKDVKNKVLQVVQLIDPGVQDLEILSRGGIRSALYVRHEEVGLAPLSALGDGVRRTLMMALTLSLVKGGVLLIDEIETAIHKSALSRVFGWLVKACSDNNVQLFATTHSLEAVDAMLKVKKVDLENVVVHRLNEIGQPAQRLSGDLLYRMRYKRGLDVR